MIIPQKKTVICHQDRQIILLRGKGSNFRVTTAPEANILEYTREKWKQKLGGDFWISILDLKKTSPADSVSPALCGGSHFLSWLSKM